MLRTIISGNRCGHNPLKPILELLSPIKVGRGGLPRILSLAKERAIKYFNKPGILPTLNASNRSSRQQRSEQREACIRVIEALLKYCDLTSLRVGIPNGEEFKNITIDFIVKQTNLTKRRVERAIRNLKKAGILKSVQPRTTNSNGEIRGLPAIRVLSRHFFAALGLERTLELERKKAYKRRKKAMQELRLKEAQRNINSTRKGYAGLLLTSLGINLSKSRRASDPNMYSKEYLLKKYEARRRELSMQVEVMKENPDWPESEIRAEVARRLA
ncbi:MAG: hypothetical protein F6K36_24200 [Symploca sp. SIO3C6]|nr:hypothetical protein [Symploca sp. SIO3C6]